MFLETIQPFAIALLIGLGVGIERERSHVEDARAAGVRTYSLIAISGAVAASAGSPVLTGGLLLMLAGLVVSGYWRSAANEDGLGLTSEIAAGLVFALGYFARQEPFLAGILGLITVSILYLRARLHFFTREVLKREEISAALTLAVFALIVLPFLADEPIDPWGLFNLRRAGQIIALIAAIEFGAYVVGRIFGAKIGRLAAGFFGGLASSTAVFMGLPKVVKEEPKHLRLALGSGMLAVAATVAFYLAIVGSVSSELAMAVAPAAVTATVLSVALGLLCGKGAEEQKTAANGSRNPLDFRGALKLGLIIFGFIALAAVAKHTLGSAALEAVNFAGGLFELHGVSFATATLRVTGAIDAETATRALLLSLLGSFVSKVGILWAFDRGRLAALMSGLLVVVIVGAGAAQWLAMRYG
jgi:uncharacterized membrane protein (DUF4010 family)